MPLAVLITELSPSLKLLHLISLTFTAHTPLNTTQLVEIF